jgi:hypothetical protein
MEQPAITETITVAAMYRARTVQQRSSNFSCSSEDSILFLIFPRIEQNRSAGKRVIPNERESRIVPTIPPQTRVLAGLERASRLALEYRRSWLGLA